MAIASVSSGDGDCDLQCPLSSSPCSSGSTFLMDFDDFEEKGPGGVQRRTSDLSERWDSDCNDSAPRPPKSPRVPDLRKKSKSTRRRRSKVVSFGAVDTIPRRSIFAEDNDDDEIERSHDQADIWYVKEELELFRSSHLEDAKMMARAHKVSDGVLLRTFELCCKGEAKLDPSLAEALRSYLQDCSDNTTRTGLERYAARKIFHDKTYRRALLLDQIFQVQRRYILDDERRENALRFACEAISFSSVHFAHQLAMAAFEQQQE